MFYESCNFVNIFALVLGLHDTGLSASRISIFYDQWIVIRRQNDHRDFSRVWIFPEPIKHEQTAHGRKVDLKENQSRQRAGALFGNFPCDRCIEVLARHP